MFMQKRRIFGGSLAENLIDRGRKRILVIDGDDTKLIFGLKGQSDSHSELLWP